MGFFFISIARSVYMHLSFFFLQLDQWLQPYTKYCLEQTGCQQYCRERDQENELFKAYLAVSTQERISWHAPIAIWYKTSRACGHCSFRPPPSFFFWTVVRDSKGLQPVEAHGLARKAHAADHQVPLAAQGHPQILGRGVRERRPFSHGQYENTKGKNNKRAMKASLVAKGGPA